MGVKGLLQCLQKATQASSISGFKGTRVAIDASGWLHKGLYAAAEDFVDSGKTCWRSCLHLWCHFSSHTALWTNHSIYLFFEPPLYKSDCKNTIAPPPGFNDSQFYVDFILSRARSLREAGVEPVLVFDGKRNNLKVLQDFFWAGFRTLLPPFWQYWDIAATPIIIW